MRAIPSMGSVATLGIPLKINPHLPADRIRIPRADWEPAMRAIPRKGNVATLGIPLKINPHRPASRNRIPRADWEPAMRAIPRKGNVVTLSIPLKINPHLPANRTRIPRADWEPAMRAIKVGPYAACRTNGNSNSNFVPLPALLSTLIRLSCRSSMRLTIARPIPFESDRASSPSRAR